MGSLPEIRSKAFQAAALRSERVRVVGVLLTLALLLLIAVGRALLSQQPGGDPLLSLACFCWSAP